MEQDRLDQQEEKNYARRSRKDEEGRDYVCGCGKSYLSYPALYTHIKTKHDGQKPEGTLKVTPAVTSRKPSSNANLNTPANIANSTLNMEQAGAWGKNQQVGGSLQGGPAVPRGGIRQQQVVYKSRIPVQALHSLQQLTTLADFPFISSLVQLNENASGFTPPDNRLKPDKVGEHIYDRYLQLVEEARQKSPDEGGRLDKLTSKSELTYAMVVYLLGVGRFVCEPVLDYYMDFCRLFRDCFADHGQEVYDICFKPKEQQEHREREHHRQRDDPYKHYEYSYPPSSSKSKSYLAQTSGQPSPVSQAPNLVLNTGQCKYSPIICDFFARVFVAAHNSSRRDSYKSIMQLICLDFCEWMYRGKLTVVDVGLTGKYEIKAKDEIKQDLDAKLTTLRDAKISPAKEKQRRKQRARGGKKEQNYSQNEKVPSHEQAGEEGLGELDGANEEDSNFASANHDEDSYKIGHSIAHEMAVRDRSESMHQFGHGNVEGDNGADSDHQLDRNGHNIDEEQIQQYINP